jgi:hypothetical protein
MPNESAIGSPLRARFLLALPIDPRVRRNIPVFEK